ncbi:N-acetylmannosamine-6-phosphate 2-epimerase [Actinoallomurus iriomotensis]|uniref:N-acylglucosamine-6-phosphate 2-epimerase n=1 Tax=Actinoallomurus iriomotensis TaxID=478107 RepID=A0A9W6RYD1_9ACTN|nr:putative N-acetylmannosamine-6-phosphate 2-epimerase [Actinoallomurus iriomotensis]GLY83774.1 putative N-acetylmannosamine-6-phosphate 2-epimerase [Actinoallomurus iriomotensis]
MILPRGSLVVSCQAPPASPFHGPAGMTLMARAAALGGAAGIRANGASDIAAIHADVDLPIIGISKTGDPDGVYITPTFAAAAPLVSAGASIVGLDATLRPRPETLSGLIARIHGELGVPVLADVDSVPAGVAAASAGADLVATTLSGYTGGPVPSEPDLELVRGLAAELSCPIVAEGRYATPADVSAAFDAGATAVVVGTAITNPTAITRRLVER